MNNIEEVLKEKGVFIFKTQGDSMEPMLVEGRDRVIVSLPKFPLKKYDVPVYRRDGHYTMHRIVKVTKKGYVICGDNRVNLERDITDKDIVGVLTAFYHNGKFVSCEDDEYVEYSKKICRNFLIRKLTRKIKRIFGKGTDKKCRI